MDNFYYVDGEKENNNNSFSYFDNKTATFNVSLTPNTYTFIYTNRNILLKCVYSTNKLNHLRYKLSS